MPAGIIRQTSYYSLLFISTGYSGLDFGKNRIKHFVCLRPLFLIFSKFPVTFWLAVYQKAESTN